MSGETNECRRCHTGLEGSLNGLMSMKMMCILCSGPHSHQLNAYGNFATHCKNTK